MDEVDQSELEEIDPHFPHNSEYFNLLAPLDYCFWPHVHKHPDNRSRKGLFEGQNRPW